MADDDDRQAVVAKSLDQLDDLRRLPDTERGSAVSSEQGAVGTVVDGSVRDPEAIVDAHYPVFASITRRVPAGSKLRLSTVGVDVPIVCGGVPVKPGDIVVGDDSGVVVCPRALIDEAVAIARRFSRAEDVMEDRIRAGGLLSDDPDAA